MKIKKAAYGLFIGSLIASLIYLLFAFGEATFSIYEWRVADRVMCSMFFALAVAIGFAISFYDVINGNK